MEERGRRSRPAGRPRGRPRARGSFDENRGRSALPRPVDLPRSDVEDEGEEPRLGGCVQKRELAIVFKRRRSRRKREPRRAVVASRCDHPMTEIKFGTSGWRAVLAEDFTFSNAAPCCRGDRARARGGWAGGQPRPGRLRHAVSRRTGLPRRPRASSPLRASDPSRRAPGPDPGPRVRDPATEGGRAVNFTASHNPPGTSASSFRSPTAHPRLPELTRRHREPRSRGSASWPAPGTARSRLRSRRLPTSRNWREGRGRRTSSEADPHFSLDFRYGTSAGFLDAYLEAPGRGSSG